MKNLNSYITFIFIFFLFFACAKKQQDNQNKILAQIGDRIITVAEFKKRAELTLRPFYCRGNTDKDKRIVLNSLIAEKLFALEAGSACEIFQNEIFTSFIKGRKEQKMRDILYDKKAAKKVKLENEEIEFAIEKTGMKYEIEFFTLNQQQAEYIQNTISQIPTSSQSLFDNIGEPKTRTVRYLDNDLPAIQQALFSQPLLPGHLCGPIKIDSDRYLVIRVQDYTFSPIISDSERQRRKQLVKEQLTLNYTQKLWDEYVSTIMHDKSIEFERDVFEQLLELFAGQMWGTENPDIDIVKEINDMILTQLTDEQDLLNRPFFKINQKSWTVSDFKKLILSHPIFFRDDYISSPRQYVKAFRTAVIDVIQDFFVTQEAYKERLDQTTSVKQEALMWQDAFVASYYQEKYIEAKRRQPDFNPDKLSGNKGTFIDILVDSLQKKNTAIIKLNRDEFNKIKLDNSSFVGFRPGVPYPSLAPPFPTNTTDDNTSYIELYIP